MTKPNDAEKLNGLLRDYLRGKIGRRQFLILGAQAGLSASALGWLDAAGARGESDRQRSGVALRSRRSRPSASPS